MTASGKCCGCARLAKDVDMTPRSDAEAPHREQGGSPSSSTTMTAKITYWLQ